MKLDKRFVFAASLCLGLGLSMAACGGDDDDDNGKQDDHGCTSEQQWNASTSKCEPIGGDDHGCLEGQNWDAEAKMCKGKPASCGNNKLDPGEVCDNVDKEGTLTVEFKDNYGSCQDWYNENNDDKTERTWKENAAPACADDCLGVKKATCEYEGDLCGNGVIDEDAGEICDVGSDKNDSADDVLKSDVTCSVLGSEEYEAGGKPACPKDCKGTSYGNGSCVLSSEVDKAVNGVNKCGSNLAIDGKTASATVSVELENSSAKAKVAIICSGKTATIDSDVQNAAFSDLGSSAIQLDLSAKPAGEYLCYVAVNTGDVKKSVVCPLAEGKPMAAGGNVSSFEGSTVAYSVAAAAGDIAVWNDFSANNMKDTLLAGMSPNAGSDTAATLKAVVGADFASVNYDIKKAQAAVGGSTITALLMGKLWPEEKPASAKDSSYLVINSDKIAGANLVIKATTGVNEGDVGHMVVVAGEDVLVEDFHAAKGDWKEATAKIPAGASEVVIYAYGMFKSKDDGQKDISNLIIDNISIRAAE